MTQRHTTRIVYSPRLISSVGTQRVLCSTWLMICTFSAIVEKKSSSSAGVVTLLWLSQLYELALATSALVSIGSNSSSSDSTTASSFQPSSSHADFADGWVRINEDARLFSIPSFYTGYTVRVSILAATSPHSHYGLWEQPLPVCGHLNSLVKRPSLDHLSSSCLHGWHH